MQPGRVKLRLEAILLLMSGVSQGMAQPQPQPQTDLVYDRAARLERATQADGSQTVYLYDPAGNRRTETATAAPSLSVVRTPTPMRVGEPGRVDWVASNASSLTQSCVPFGREFAQVLDAPLTCTWAAKNDGVQVTSFVNNLITVAGMVSPALVFTSAPSPMIAGKPCG